MTRTLHTINATLLTPYGFDGGGAVGAIGDALGAERGALPVVLGGDIGELIGALPVVTAGELLAVFLLLFQPAIRIIAIKTTTAMPAIQPHIPSDEPGWRSTGSLSRWSKRGSDMAVLLGWGTCRPSQWKTRWRRSRFRRIRNAFALMGTATGAAKGAAKSPS